MQTLILTESPNRVKIQRDGQTSLHENLENVALFVNREHSLIAIRCKGSNPINLNVALPDLVVNGVTFDDLSEATTAIKSALSEAAVITESLTTASDLNIINAVDSGLDNTGSANNTSLLQSLIGSNKTIFFPRGTYLFNTSVNISTVSNLKLMGEAGTIFTSPQDTIIRLSGSLESIEMTHISFTSTHTSTTDNPDGLVLIEDYGNGIANNDLYGQYHGATGNSFTNNF